MTELIHGYLSSEAAERLDILVELEQGDDFIVDYDALRQALTKSREPDTEWYIEENHGVRVS